MSELRKTDREWRIGVINGPNMPNLANRDPDNYGDVGSIEALEERIAGMARQLGARTTAIASNHEGEILEWIHRNASQLDGIIINPAGLTMYGQSTRHALVDSGLPVIEVHFGNIARGSYTSVFTPSVVGVVHGLRKHSYAGALLAMVSMLDDGDFVKPKRYRDPWNR